MADSRLKAPRREDDLVTIDRAAAITGYSPTFIHHMIRAGNVGFIPGVRGSKQAKVSKSEVEGFIAEHRKRGGQFLPRTQKHRRKSHHAEPASNGRPDTTITVDADAKILRRIDRYLQKFADTPMEMSKREFVTRVLERELKRLGA